MHLVFVEKAKLVLTKGVVHATPLRLGGMAGSRLQRLPSTHVRCPHPHDRRLHVYIRHHSRGRAYPSQLCSACGHIFHVRPVRIARLHKGLKVFQQVEWFWPGREGTVDEELLKSEPPPGERWITVHPNKGNDTEGQPVLIKEHPDGTAHIIGGAGGSLTGLHLTRLKSAGQLHTERLGRAQERREQPADVRSQMTMDQIGGQASEREKLRGMHEKVMDQKIALAKELGLVDRGPELSDEEMAGLTSDEVQAAVRQRRQKVHTAVNKLFSELKQEVAHANPLQAAELHRQLSHEIGKTVRESFGSVFGGDATEYIARIMGETFDDMVMPEVKRDGITVADTIARRAKANGLTPEILQQAQEHAEQQAGELATLFGYADSPEDYRAKLAVARDRAKEQAATNEKVKALKQKLQIGESENLEQKTDALRKLGELRARERAIQYARQKLEDWDPRIDQPLPSGVALVQQRLTRHAIDPAALQQQLEADLEGVRQKEAATRLLDAVYGDHGLERKQKVLGDAVADAHFGTLSDVAYQLTGAQFGLDKQAVDHLGVQAGARALVNWMRSSMKPKQLQAAKDALAEYHQRTQVELQTKAVDRAEACHGEAQSLRQQYLPVDDQADHSSEADELAHVHNQWVDAKIAGLTLEARQSLSEALGHMEAMGALNFAFMDELKPDTVDVPLGKTGPEKAYQIAYGSGLAEGDFEHITDGLNDFLRVKTDKLTEAYHDPYPQVQERLGILKSFAKGEHDELGWRPQGIVDKTQEYADPEDVIQSLNFAHPLELGEGMAQGDINQAVHDWVMGQLDARMGGEEDANDIADIRRTLSSESFQADAMGKVGTDKRKALDMPYAEAVMQAFPDPGGLKQRGLTLASQMEAWQKDWLRRQGREQDADRVQYLDDNAETQHTAERVLAAHPEFAGAYGRLGDGRVRTALEHFFYGHVNKDKELEPGTPEAAEGLRKAYQDRLQRRYNGVAQWRRTRGSAGQAGLGFDLGEEPTGGPKTVEQLSADDIAGMDRDEVERKLAEVEHVATEPVEIAPGMGKRALDLGDQGKVRATLREAAERGLNAYDHNRGLLEQIQVASKAGKPVAVLAKEAKAHGETYDRLKPHVQRWATLEGVREGLEEAQGHFDDDEWARQLEAGPIPNMRLENGAIRLAEGYVPAYEDAGLQTPWQSFVESFRGSGTTQTNRAYRALQAGCRGHFNQLFADDYGKVARALNLSTVPVPYGKEWAVAQRSAKERRNVRAQEVSRRRRLIWTLMPKDARGRLAHAGGAGAMLEAEQTHEERTEAATRALIEHRPEDRPSLYRHGLGASAEKTLERAFRDVAQGYLPTGDRPVAPTKMPSEPVHMDGDYINQQRAIKVIKELKRHGINQTVGSGKTMVGLGAFTDLHAEGKVHKGLFVVPTTGVLSFVRDKRRFVDPSFRMFVEPGADAARRHAAYSSPDHQMMLVTQESLREDLSWALGQDRFNGDSDTAKAWALHANPNELHGALKAAVAKQGWDGFDYLMMDEAHQTLKRKGKPDTLLAKLTDAYSHDMPYFVSSTAHSSKNDVSETHDFLHKMAPEEFTDDNEAKRDFMRRFKGNTQATMDNLQRVAAAYSFTQGVNRKHSVYMNSYDLEPHQEQVAAYAKIQRAAEDARGAFKQRDLPALVAAMEQIKPDYFGDRSQAEKEGIARDLLPQKINGAKDAALDLVVDGWRMDQNPKAHQLEGILEQSRDEDGTHQPGLVFAQRLEAAKAIRDHLQSKGYHVGYMDGTMTQPERERVNREFEGVPGMPPVHDMLVLSNAGALAQNLPRAQHVVNWDTPDTPMMFQQRVGRGDRSDRVGDLNVHHLRVKLPHEQRRIEIMRGKEPLIDALQNAHAALDDTGMLRQLMVNREHELNLIEQAQEMRMAAG